MRTSWNYSSLKRIGENKKVLATKQNTLRVIKLDWHVWNLCRTRSDRRCFMVISLQCCPRQTFLSSCGITEHDAPIVLLTQNSWDLVASIPFQLSWFLISPSKSLLIEHEINTTQLIRQRLDRSQGKVWPLCSLLCCKSENWIFSVTIGKILGNIWTIADGGLRCWFEYYVKAVFLITSNLPI